VGGGQVADAAWGSRLAISPSYSNPHYQVAAILTNAGSMHIRFAITAQSGNIIDLVEALTENPKCPFRATSVF
jgi:hypothetical protein